MEKRVAPLQAAVESSEDEWVGPPERRLLESILIAFGYMDALRSHAQLARLIRESTSHLVLADALEATAFEEVRFDFDLAIPLASDRSRPAEILSALYALEFHDYANERPEEARALIEPLLAHPYPLVRVFGISVLKFRASNLDLVLLLAEDPNEHVQRAVVEATEWIGTLDSSPTPHDGSS